MKAQSNSINASNAESHITAFINKADSSHNINLRLELQYLLKAYRISSQYKIVKGQHLLESYIGRNYGFIGKPDSAYYYMDKCIAYYSNVNDQPSLGNSYLLLYNIHRVNGKYDKGLAIAHKALNIFEKLNDKIGIAKANTAVADMLRMLESNVEAKKYIDKAYNYQQSLPQPSPDYGYTCRIMGDIALQLAGDTGSIERNRPSLNYQYKGVEIARQLNDKLLLTRTLTGYGNSLKYMDMTKEAEAAYHEGFALASQLDAVVYRNSHMVNLLSFYKKANRIVEAKQLALKVVQDLQSMNSTFNMADTYESLADSYRRLGNADSAYYYMTQREIVHDSMVSIQNRELQVKYDIAQKETVLSNQHAQISSLKVWIWAIALLLAVAFFVGYTMHSRSKFKQKLHEQEAVRLRELDEFKNRFFTNISHEFRTPLTVILGMTEQLHTDPTTIPTHTYTNGLSLIRRNGHNLLKLINQILDLAKLESNTFKLHFIHSNIVAYLKYVFESFQSYAMAQGVTLEFKSSAEKINMDYDIDRTLQIMHNLLANAIKFSKIGGQVILQIDATEKLGQPYLQIKVIDNGIGIAAEDQQMIFDRFYQAKNKSNVNNSGTGIGLALTKEFVIALGGTINVLSESGLGSTFIVHLPIHNEAEYSPFEPQSNEIGFANINKVTPPVLTQIRESQEANPVILVIEDNEDVVSYLSECLGPHYDIHFAFDGQQGIDKTFEVNPDIIISDVMMPVKDGFEVLNELKNDDRSSHIPIVMLTAKADIESKLTGLRRGADAYIAKPFYRDELFVTLTNLIDIRKKLQLKYSATALQISTKDENAVAVTEPNNQEIEINEADHAFILQLRQIVMDYLADPMLDVDMICKKMGMGKTNLYAKMKALTGLSVVIYIRKMRLQQARELLTQTSSNISEIAYMVGYNDPKFFSRVFKEEYGVSPSDMRQAH